MKKTKVIIFLVIILIFINVNNIYSKDTNLSTQKSSSLNFYSNGQYSLNIPSSYNMISEGNFTNSNGNTITIKTFSYNTEPPKYNKRNLEELLEVAKDTMKKEIPMYSSIEMNVEKKEITKFSKNNYKAYHYIMSFVYKGRIAYIEEYISVTEFTAYIIVIGAGSKNELFSDDNINMLNSFTIKNYSEPSSSFLSSELLEKMFITSVVTFIFGIIDILIKRNKEKDDDHIPTTFIGNKKE